MVQCSPKWVAGAKPTYIHTHEQWDVGAAIFCSCEQPFLWWQPSVCKMHFQCCGGLFRQGERGFRMCASECNCLADRWIKIENRTHCILLQDSSRCHEFLHEIPRRCHTPCSSRKNNEEWTSSLFHLVMRYKRCNSAELEVNDSPEGPMPAFNLVCVQRSGIWSLTNTNILLSDCPFFSIAPRLHFMVRFLNICFDFVGCRPFFPTAEMKSTEWSMKKKFCVSNRACNCTST